MRGTDKKGDDRLRVLRVEVGDSLGDLPYRYGTKDIFSDSRFTSNASLRT